MEPLYYSVRVPEELIVDQPRRYRNEAWRAVLSPLAERLYTRLIELHRHSPEAPLMESMFNSGYCVEALERLSSHAGPNVRNVQVYVELMRDIQTRRYEMVIGVTLNEPQRRTVLEMGPGRFAYSSPVSMRPIPPPPPAPPPPPPPAKPMPTRSRLWRAERPEEAPAPRAETPQTITRRIKLRR